MKIILVILPLVFERQDREGGRETQEGGDMGMYAYV